jgi:hypothetical protein
VVGLPLHVHRVARRTGQQVVEIGERNQGAAVGLELDATILEQRGVGRAGALEVLGRPASS